MELHAPLCPSEQSNVALVQATPEIQAFKSKLDALLLEYERIFEQNRVLQRAADEQDCTTCGATPEHLQVSEIIDFEGGSQLLLKVQVDASHGTMPEDDIDTLDMGEVQPESSPGEMNLKGVGKVHRAEKDVKFLTQACPDVAQDDVPDPIPDDETNDIVIEESDVYAEAYKTCETVLRMSPTPTSRYGRSRASMHRFFQDDEAVKEMVRSHLVKEPYDVRQYYKTNGFVAKIARSMVFENSSLFVIAVYSIWTAIDTDHNTASYLVNAHPVWIVAEQFFCTYFFFEIVIRFAAFADKRRCLRDAWFVFDLILVIFMVFEVWVLTLLMLSTSQGQSIFYNLSLLRIARVMRLFRILRMARLLRLIPELGTLSKAIVAALRSVCFTLLLLFAVVYVYGIIFTQFMRDTTVGQKYFDSVPQSMHILFMHGTLLDNVADIFLELQPEGAFPVFLLYSFIIFSGITAMNMLIGVICEVIGSVAVAEKELSRCGWIKDIIGRLLADESPDLDGDGRISRGEFCELIKSQRAILALQEVGVDVLRMPDYLEMIFEGVGPDPSMSSADLVQAIFEIAGNEPARMNNICDLRMWLKRKFDKQAVQLHAGLQEMNQTLRQLEDHLHSGGLVEQRHREGLNAPSEPSQASPKEPPMERFEQAVSKLDTFRLI